MARGGGHNTNMDVGPLDTVYNVVENARATIMGDKYPNFVTKSGLARAAAKKKAEEDKNRAAYKGPEFHEPLGIEQVFAKDPDDRE